MSASTSCGLSLSRRIAPNGSGSRRISIGAGDGKTYHARHFRFSILGVFGPSTSPSEVDDAESHYKRALMTREFGLNRN